MTHLCHRSFFSSMFLTCCSYITCCVCRVVKNIKSISMVFLSRLHYLFFTFFIWLVVYILKKTLFKRLEKKRKLPKYALRGVDSAVTVNEQFLNLPGLIIFFLNFYLFIEVLVFMRLFYCHMFRAFLDVSVNSC